MKKYILTAIFTAAITFGSFAQIIRPNVIADSLAGVDAATIVFAYDTTASADSYKIATRYDVDTLTTSVYDTLADHLDSLQLHDDRINLNLDSITAHNIRINDLVDTAAVHLDTLQDLRVDLNADINALDTTVILYAYDTIPAAASFKISTRYDIDTTTTNVWDALAVRCLEAVFGDAIGTGLTLDGTTLKTHLSLQSIAGLTETNGGIMYGTADNAYAWLAAGTSTYVLQANGAAAPTWLDIAGTYYPISGGAITGAVDVQNTWTLSKGSQDYLFTDRSNNFVIQGQSSGAESIIEIFSKDSDLSDDAGTQTYALGLPASVSNRVRMFSGWNAGNTQFEIYTEEGGTGVGQDLVLYTEKADGSSFNVDQLKFNTDGTILMPYVLILGDDVLNQSGQTNYIASDGDACDDAITTSDERTFNNASGGYKFDGAIVGRTYNFGADAEASDAYVITLAPAPAALTVGMMCTFTANTANTDGATFNPNSFGANAILKMNDQALVTGDIEAGQVVVVVWDGANYQMTSQLAQ